MLLHHATLFVADPDRSLRFYRDGLGFDLFADVTVEGDWPTLFGVESTTLRVLVLGQPDTPDSGRLELAAPVPPLPAALPHVGAGAGTTMLAFYVDLGATLALLSEYGASDVRESKLRNGTPIATVRDPDGVLVELIERAPL